LQGLIVLDLKTKQTLTGKAITVDYLSTNPINRRADSGLKYVGLALMTMAVLRSRELDAQGEIWLEALPSACRFYEWPGMAKQPAPSRDGYPVYLVGREMAQRLLDECSNRGILTI
jgi:hypothetical protein